MPLATERTTFSLDVPGRYTCNTLAEALDSTKTAKDPKKGPPDPDARDFDIIVIGGGTFGLAFASHLFNQDQRHQHRILILEGGLFTFPEHFQDLPMLNTGEVWGVPWNSDSPQPQDQVFPGLAYCVGGRSVFWGGWSPRFIDSELPSPPWPASVVNDLTQPVLNVGGKAISYLDQAAEEVGADATNDFVSGPLQDAMRAALFKALKARPADPKTRLTGQFGKLDAEAALEAPLAVESTSPRAGYMPFNKWSSVPLIIRAARAAYIECPDDDVKKRLMLADESHVISLQRSGRRITGVVTNKGTVPLPDGGQVFLALGTIENTRMALASLPNQNQLIGRNLMAHLRSNLTFRVPRQVFGDALDPARHPEAAELQVSALFVKGVHTHDDGSLGHFHLQITASGVGQTGRDSEEELWKKIPDTDLLDRFKGLTDKWVVVTIRGIAEIVGDKTSPDPRNRVALDQGGPQGPYDYGQPRARVRLDVLPAGSKELRLWDTMDQVSREVALMFAGKGPIQYLSKQGDGAWQDVPPDAPFVRDSLSSTHHESGTTWMGDATTPSVTDDLGRFKETDNLFALGPSLLPTMGSPNPVLGGVALARRTSDKLVSMLQDAPPALEPGFAYLFDGTERMFKAWQLAGQGKFTLVDGMLFAEPGNDLGLLYYSAQNFSNFTLKLEFRMTDGNENSGVFVRFRDPRQRVPDRNDPAKSYDYANKAFVGVDTGFEVQIDDLARGNPQSGIPDGLDESRTGAIYHVPIGNQQDKQVYQRPPKLVAGNWNTYEVTVNGNTYTAVLNGLQTSTFTNTDAFRGKPASADPASGYVGIQSHTGRVVFRNIRIKPV
jgi:choline dehydrogenase-like flavoprotein